MSNIRVSKEEYLDYLGVNSINVSREGIGDTFRAIKDKILGKLKSFVSKFKKEIEEEKEKAEEDIKHDLSSSKKNTGNEGIFDAFKRKKYNTRYVVGFLDRSPDFHLAFGDAAPAVSSPDGVFGKDNIFYIDVINKKYMPGLTKIFKDADFTAYKNDDFDKLDDNMRDLFTTIFANNDLYHEEFGVGTSKDPIVIKLNEHVTKNSDIRFYDNWAKPILDNIKIARDVIGKSNYPDKKRMAAGLDIAEDIVEQVRYYTIEMFWNNTTPL